MNAFSQRKGFQFAYRGFEIGSPAVDKRIMIWAEGLIGVGEEPNRAIFFGKDRGYAGRTRTPPDAYQWTKDQSYPV
jgi:hypothetical protein